MYTNSPCEKPTKSNTFGAWPFGDIVKQITAVNVFQYEADVLRVLIPLNEATDVLLKRSASDECLPDCKVINVLQSGTDVYLSLE